MKGGEAPTAFVTLRKILSLRMHAVDLKKSLSSVEPKNLPESPGPELGTLLRRQERAIRHTLPQEWSVSDAEDFGQGFYYALIFNQMELFYTDLFCYHKPEDFIQGTH